tara:strand:- start:452 stop:658 length:207 start_codon:yes stop_codon:yes gene_type:complete
MKVLTLDDVRDMSIKAVDELSMQDLISIDARGRQEIEFNVQDIVMDSIINVLKREKIKWDTYGEYDND